MSEYKSNSHKSKEREANEKKIERVVSGRVKTKKKSDVRKLTDVFISEDISNVKSYVLMDILVPAIKKAISDIVVNGIDMILYGETGKTNKRSSITSKMSYGKYYDNNESRRDYSARSRRSRYEFEDIILDNRGEAEEVISMMEDIIERYDVVTISDLCELVGITGPHTGNRYGWDDIRNASVIRVRDGYLLKLPRAIPLD